ncbi:MAG: TIGR00288 family NYN domain-containing protein [Candidatus ainarchaeum sp.]|nr:TIGR00288 family NYN domain-containing protein [Candidatus ainarchaeum sp.]MDD4128342.1 TIGR00288 family NYN domain-containing protein [Candidatus ainarchaeum sp.]
MSSLKKWFNSWFNARSRRVAVFVDGPNLLRKEFGIDIDSIKKEAQKFGSIKIGRVYLNQFASDKLVEATVNQGFSPIISATDVDVVMACDATEVAFNSNIDVIIFATRDSDFLPALIKAKEHGKETVALVAEEMSAAALKNTADKVVFLKGKKVESKNDKIDHKKDSPRTTTNLNQKLVTVQPKVDEKKESKS